MFSHWFKWLGARNGKAPHRVILPGHAPILEPAPLPDSFTITSVSIVEDYPPLRTMIRRILDTQPDLHVVGEAADGLRGCELLERRQPDVLVTDLLLPAMSGCALIRHTRAHFPEIAIVAVSIERDDPYIQGAFDSGALAFVHKSCLHDHLADAVRSAVIGKKFLRLP